MDRQPRALIHAALYLLPSEHIPVNSMFWSEQRDQLDSRRDPQNIDCRFQIGVYPRRIGNQSDALSFQRFETARGQNLISKLDRTSK